MRLMKIVPPTLTKYFGSAITMGYKASAKLVRDTDFLDWVIGKEQRPYIRRAAIEFFALRNAHKVKGLVAIPQKNKTGNCTHLEVRFNNLIITFHHLGMVHGELQAVPRQAAYRDALAMGNSQESLMAQLFPQDPELSDSMLYAFVAHTGNEAPEDASLIIPTADNRGIIDQMPILLKGQSEVETEKIEEFDVTLKEFKKELGYGN
jgi:hypothetical protein